MASIRRAPVSKRFRLLTCGIRANDRCGSLCRRLDRYTQCETARAIAPPIPFFLALFRRNAAGIRIEHTFRKGLKVPIGTFPTVFMGLVASHHAKEFEQSIPLGLDPGDSGQGHVVVAGLDEFDLAVRTDSNTRLGRFDFSASDTSPCGQPSDLPFGNDQWRHESSRQRNQSMMIAVRSRLDLEANQEPARCRLRRALRQMACLVSRSGYPLPRCAGGNKDSVRTPRTPARSHRVSQDLARTVTTAHGKIQESATIE